MVALNQVMGTPRPFGFPKRELCYTTNTGRAGCEQFTNRHCASRCCDDLSFRGELQRQPDMSSASVL